MVSIVVFMPDVTFWPKMIFYLSIQTFSWLNIIIVRPFDEWKDNLIELINETQFVIIIIFHLIWRTPEEWNKGLRVFGFLNFFMCCGFIISVISFINLIVGTI